MSSRPTAVVTLKNSPPVCSAYDFNELLSAPEPSPMVWILILFSTAKLIFSLVTLTSPSDINIMLLFPDFPLSFPNAIITAEFALVPPLL